MDQNEELKFAKDNQFFALTDDQIKEKDGHVQFDTTVKCAGSGETEKITIGFYRDKSFDPNYESEEIKTIKESGLIPEDEIKFENGYMYFNNGGFSIDTPRERDFHYRIEYIKYNNKKTIESLQDKQTITFYHPDHVIPESDYSDGDELEGLYYDDFLANKLNLENPDEIVLAQSYIRLHFNSPTYRDHTTFTIHADDEMKGFTRKELAIKCMKYYHMQYYLSQNYDLDKGCFIESKAINQVYNKDSEFNQALEENHRKNPSMDWLFKESEKTIKFPEPIFHPVLYNDEYTNNGLKELEYNKENKHWVFICIDYI